MSNDLKPLKHYINNREKMLQQAFLSIQETQLQKLIPTSLRHLPVEELKAECLVQLLGMSKKRILSVLEGRTLESSSSSSESEQDDTISDKLRHKRPKNISKDKAKSFITGNGTSDLTSLNNTSEAKKMKMEKEEKTKGEDSQKRKNKIQKAYKTDEEEKQPTEDKEKDGKTLLEILELEMRAKAIRALLRHVEGEEQDSNNSKQELNQVTTKAPATTTVITQDEIDLTLDDDDYNEGNSQVESINSSKEECDNLTERDDNETTKSVSDPSEPEELGWTNRWLKSNDVRRVVATSKMITSVRKKMRIIHKNKNPDRGKNSGMNIEGSVNEYRMLSKDHDQQQK